MLTTTRLTLAHHKSYKILGLARSLPQFSTLLLVAGWTRKNVIKLFYNLFIIQHLPKGAFLAMDSIYYVFWDSWTKSYSSSSRWSIKTLMMVNSRCWLEKSVNLIFERKYSQLFTQKSKVEFNICQVLLNYHSLLMSKVNFVLTFFLWRRTLNFFYLS